MIDNNDDEDIKMDDSEAEFPIPAALRIKYKGYEFYDKILGSPKYVVAPMVDASELAWRLLSRRHGAQLCYTPMFHANCFAKDPKYRKEALQSCAEDRPLLIQFCGNDPKILLEAALLAQDHCDGIDINLGCPQSIAKRGHYGAFLQDEWDLLKEIIETLHANLHVPVTCKIRIFDDVTKTIQYAKMLENAGAQILTIHGRTRDQKGPLTGVADWNHIKIVRENLEIPLFANGNIQCLEDVQRCLFVTGADGIMSAEGNLSNPCLFEGINPITWEIANEYLELLEKYPAPRSYVRGHLFKIFHHLLSLKSNYDVREVMATSHTVKEFRSVTMTLEDKYKPFHEGLSKWDDELENEEENDYNLKLPPWICQPYVRITPEEHKQKLAYLQMNANKMEEKVSEYFDEEGNKISRKLMKKIKRLRRKPKLNKCERHDEACIRDECSNTKGLKCEYNLCRVCCRKDCFTINLNCKGHKINIKERRDRAKLKYSNNNHTQVLDFS